MALLWLPLSLADSGVVRSRPISPDFARFRPISPDLAPPRYRQNSPGLARCRPMSPALARFRPTDLADLADLARSPRCRPISLDFAKYHMISLDFARSRLASPPRSHPNSSDLAWSRPVPPDLAQFRPTDLPGSPDLADLARSPRCRLISLDVARSRPLDLTRPHTISPHFA